jgi:hypothetical protein
MAVLVLLSVGTGYLFSLGATFFFEGQQFYEASAVLVQLAKSPLRHNSSGSYETRASGLRNRR